MPSLIPVLTSLRSNTCVVVLSFSIYTKAESLLNSTALSGIASTFSARCSSISALALYPERIVTPVSYTHLTLPTILLV